MESLYPSEDPGSEARWVANVAYGLTVREARELTTGHLHQTFLLRTDRGALILQRLSDLFQDSPALGANWRSIWELAGRHSETAAAVPEILPDLTGQDLFRSEIDGSLWRLTVFQEGQTPPSLNPAAARSAAALLGRLHRALNQPRPADLLPLPSGEFTNQHLSRPEEFKNLRFLYRGHPKLQELDPLIEKGIQANWQLPLHPAFQQVFQMHDVIIHGDPKRDNFLFTNGQARVLLDWDTVGLGQILIDLAEMSRSFGIGTGAGGNPEVSVPVFLAVLEGYRETGLLLEPADLSLLPAVLRAVLLNLGRRYLTDALAEVHFQLDRTRYSSLFEQNRDRAWQMLAAADQLLTLEMELAASFIEGY